jgi:divalent metal cation (Fe/Co/Zn/Cd) transporter
MSQASPFETADRQLLIARAQRLEYLTIVWNVLEALVALVSGILAGSFALVGFGLDSVIEAVSGAALLWRLRQDYDPKRRAQAERKALRWVGFCFIVLAIFVAEKGTHAVLKRIHPAESVVGIAVAVAALIVMPVLAHAKRRIAGAIRSGALRADSRQTEFCGYLSLILLGGLLLNALRGWWWADPMAALAMAPLIGKEGIEALRGGEERPRFKLRIPR